MSNVFVGIDVKEDDGDIYQECNCHSHGVGGWLTNSNARVVYGDWISLREP